MEVFVRNGFTGASMDLVATQAGVARRTLYNQFSSKEALFKETIANLWKAVTITKTDKWSHIDDPVEGLTRFGTEIVEFWAVPAHVDMLRMVLAESLRSRQLLSEFIEAGKGPAFRATVAYLELLRTVGRLKFEDSRLAANQFLGLLNEPLLWQRVLGIGRPAPASYRAMVVRNAVRIFVGHYGVPAGRTPKPKRADGDR